LWWHVLRIGPLFLLGRGAGFTLIEVLFSILFISLGVLGFSANTVGVMKAGHISSNITVATNLAQDKMEQLKALGAVLPACPTATTAGCFDGPLDPQGVSALSGAIYRRSWVVSPDTPEEGLVRVEVTVSWIDYLPRTVTLTTLVFRG